MKFLAVFEADYIIIDLEFAPDPLEYTFRVLIQNNSDSNLYFKLTCNVPNWSIESPADGKLGLVNAGSTKEFKVKIMRANPGSELTETGTFVLEAYSDDTYSNLIDSAELDVTIDIVDGKTWTVQGWTFDDGTTQGWTLDPDDAEEPEGYGVTNERSLRAGGYSIYVKTSYPDYPGRLHVKRSLTVGSGSKAIFVGYFKLFKRQGSGTGTGKGKLDVYINGSKVYDGIMLSLSLSQNTTKETPWYKFVLDLTEYMGQTVTIEIDMYVTGSGSGYVNMYFDDPFMAYK